MHNATQAKANKEKSLPIWRLKVFFKYFIKKFLDLFIIIVLVVNLLEQTYDHEIVK